jgi:cytoskeletal protein RodZ
MNCEQFESIGLDLDRESALDIDAAERAAVIDHANTCARCAALQESWREARIELQALREMTSDAGAPQRVEMRLRQEFFARTRAQKARRFAIASAWVLASAAMLLVGMNWWNWHITNENISLGSTNTAANTNANSSAAANNASNTTPSSVPSYIDSYPTEAANESTLVAANDAEDFTVLPGSMAQEAGDGSVVRVRMQRGALGDLGLPVNEERANEWIQVDLLVGQDGQPQAVRLPQAQ